MQYFSRVYDRVQLDDCVRFVILLRAGLTLFFPLLLARYSCRLLLICFFFCLRSSVLFSLSLSRFFFCAQHFSQFTNTPLNSYKFNFSHLVLRCAYFTDFQPNLANVKSARRKNTENYDANTANSAQFFFFSLSLSLFLTVYILLLPSIRNGELHARTRKRMVYLTSQNTRLELWNHKNNCTAFATPKKCLFGTRAEGKTKKTQRKSKQKNREKKKSIYYQHGSTRCAVWLHFERQTCNLITTF